MTQPDRLKEVDRYLRERLSEAPVGFWDDHSLRAYLDDVAEHACWACRGLLLDALDRTTPPKPEPECRIVQDRRAAGL